MTGTQEYAEAYRGDYGFERVVVELRQRQILELITKMAPRIVVEVGCGLSPLFVPAQRGEIAFERWIVVEPAGDFVAAAQTQATGDQRIAIAESRAEEADWSALLPEAPSLIVISSLLHELAEPQRLLQTAAAIADAGSVVHANVPNADSLHRQLAVDMGLMDSVDAKSARNVALDQPHVFNREAFHRLFDAAGFDVFESGGYLLKPFAHAQMEAIMPVLGADVLDGLFAMGQRMPELAAEIFVNARLR